MTDNLMKRQLDKVRKAYDLTVERYRLGIDPYENIPQGIKDSAFYKFLKSDSHSLSSGAHDVRDYLAPETGMRFLDAGCSANLANYRLDRWPSLYYGVDISPALIDAMKGFVTREGISIGGLYVSDITGLPFDDNFFDIAAVIGVIEYFDLPYIAKALAELNRVCRPEARLVLDVPNKEHPYARDMMELEQHLGRPNYHHERSSYEKLLASLFEIERIDDSCVMIKYCVRARK